MNLNSLWLTPHFQPDKLYLPHFPPIPDHVTPKPAYQSILSKISPTLPQFLNPSG